MHAFCRKLCSQCKSVKEISVPAELIQQKHVADVWAVREMVNKSVITNICHHQPIPVPSLFPFQGYFVGQNVPCALFTGLNQNIIIESDIILDT